MKKLFTLLVMLAFMQTMLNAKGHHDHKHHVDKSEIEEHAKKQLAFLVKKEKIDKSFAGAVLADTSEKKFGKFTEWVVRFDNDKIKEKSEYKTNLSSGSSSFNNRCKTF